MESGTSSSSTIAVFNNSSFLAPASTSGLMKLDYELTFYNLIEYKMINTSYTKEHNSLRHTFSKFDNASCNMIRETRIAQVRKLFWLKIKKKSEI